MRRQLIKAPSDNSLELQLSKEFPQYSQRSLPAMSEKELDSLVARKKPRGYSFSPDPFMQKIETLIVEGCLPEIGYLMEKYPSIRRDILKLAAEKGSFHTIAFVISKRKPGSFLGSFGIDFINDEMLEATRARSQMLYDYIVMSLRRELADDYENPSSWMASKLKPLCFLNDLLKKTAKHPTASLMHSIYFPCVVDFICEHPKICNQVYMRDSGNTLLHELVRKKETETEEEKESATNVVKSFMSAIMEAGHYCPELSFDIEQKNSAEKTVLELALDGQNKDIICAVLLYGNPKYKDLEKRLHDANIDLAAIFQERTALDRKLMQKVSHLSLANNEVLMSTNLQLMMLAQQFQQLAAENRGMRRALEIQEQESVYYRAALQLMCEQQGIPLPSPEIRPMLTTEAANPVFRLLPLATQTPGMVFVHPRLPVSQDGVPQEQRRDGAYIKH